jgi:hypothetical protein
MSKYGEIAGRRHTLREIRYYRNLEFGLNMQIPTTFCLNFIQIADFQ